MPCADAADLPTLLGPARNPCTSCPYRRDVPARIWHPQEYAKLARYDLPTSRQPPAVFRCHQSAGDARARVCAGWAHVHARNPPGHELLALRVAVIGALLTAATARATATYTTAVPCFTCGAEAAGHGMTGELSARGAAMAAAIVRRRPETATPGTPRGPRPRRSQRRS